MGGGRGQQAAHTDHGQVVRQHRNVLDALTARDPDAAAATIDEQFTDVTARVGRWTAGTEEAVTTGP